MEVFETELEALGLFGIQDPLRDAIVSSVEVVSKAGISVIMCTGDNLDTAIAISKKISETSWSCRPPNSPLGAHVASHRKSFLAAIANHPRYSSEKIANSRMTETSLLSSFFGISTTVA